MREGAWLAAALVLAGAVAAGLSLDGEARSTGITNPKYAKAGCLCHGQGSLPIAGTVPGAPEGGTPSASTEVTVTVADAGNNTTTEFVAGETYTVTITVSNPSVQSLPNPMYVAGFGIWTDAGTFESPDGTSRSEAGGVWATQTQAGARQSQWTLAWTAPQANNSTFHFAGNKVNGNAQNDPLDQWNTGTLALLAGGAAPPPVDNETDNETEDGDDKDEPGFEFVPAVLTVLAAAWWIGRRRR